MAINITNSTQLSTFETLRTILLGSTIISSKFNNNNIHEFEPQPKEMRFGGYPYLVINVPETDTEILTFKNLTTKTHSITITLAVEYDAKDNYTRYANQIIYQIESSLSILEAIGLYNTTISSDKPSVDDLHQKKVISGNFVISHDGVVSR